MNQNVDKPIDEQNTGGHLPNGHANRVLNEVKMDLNGLFSPEQIKALIRNNSPQYTWRNNIPKGYIRIRSIGYSALLTEIDPDDPKYSFGLIDDNSNISIGPINLYNLNNIALSAGDSVVSDINFAGTYPLAVYAMAAAEIGSIVIEDRNQAFNDVFEKFKSGKNSDETLDLSRLKKTFLWV